MDKISVAKWIVDNSLKYKINPELVNKGIWFYSSSIIGSEYKLNKTLKNISDAETMLDYFSKNVKSAYNNCVISS